MIIDIGYVQMENVNWIFNSKKGDVWVETPKSMLPEKSKDICFIIPIYDRFSGKCGIRYDKHSDLFIKVKDYKI